MIITKEKLDELYDGPSIKDRDFWVRVIEVSAGVKALRLSACFLAICKHEDFDKRVAFAQGLIIESLDKQAKEHVASLNTYFSSAERSQERGASLPRRLMHTMDMKNEVALPAIVELESAHEDILHEVCMLRKDELDLLREG